MLTATLQSGASGAAAAAVLHIFFRSVQDRWPEQYSSLSSLSASFATRGMAHYVAFRTAPVYLVGVFAAVTADRLDLKVALALAVMTALHLTMTNGRALARLIRRRARDPRFATLGLYYAATSVAVVGATALAGVTSGFWQAAIPGPNEVVLALWIGIIAAVLSAYVRTLRPSEDSEEALIARARQDAGPDIWAYAERAALERDCDSTFVQAIIAAEVVQRPAWFRRLERLKAGVAPRGTYGVAQVAAEHPITDRQSVDVLTDAYSGYYPERTDDGYIKWDRMAARVEEHNPSTSFIEAVRDIYTALQPYALHASKARAHDQRPVIEVAEVKRVRHEWHLHGTATVYEGNLLLASEDGDGRVEHGSVQASTGGPRRGTWHLTLPLDARRLWLSEEVMDEASPASEDRTAFVDLDQT